MDLAYDVDSLFWCSISNHKHRTFHPVKSFFLHKMKENRKIFKWDLAKRGENQVLFSNMRPVDILFCRSKVKPNKHDDFEIVFFIMLKNMHNLIYHFLSPLSLSLSLYIYIYIHLKREIILCIKDKEIDIYIYIYIYIPYTHSITLFESNIYIYI